MKPRFLLAIACVLAVQGAEAAGPATGSTRSNLAATRQHYSQLVQGPVPNTALLTLFTNMLPKGGDLHHHYSGAIYAENYLEWVGALNYCVYRATDAALKAEKFRIASKPQELSDPARAICTGADAVREDNAFYRELLMHWSDKDYGNHFHEQRAPDQQFFDTFGYFGAVSSYDYRGGLRSLKARAQAENLGYLETMLRGGPVIDKPELESLLNALTAQSSAPQIDEALARAHQLLANDADTAARVADYAKSLEEAAAGIDDETFRLRFQSYASRNSTPAKVFSSLYTSFAALQHTRRLVGVNILGPENGHVAMRDYSLHMRMLAFLKGRFPEARLSLHAGELAMGMVPPEGLRSHIREAVLVAGAQRIGHGVDIAHEEDAAGLMDVMKQRKVAVEVNLTSNEFILGVKDEAHPLRLYARHGVPFLISTDDAGVSRNNLSTEYLLYVSRYRPSYDELKRVVYNSIRYAFLPEDEKREETAKLDRRFAEFEARIARLPRPGR